VSRRLPNEEQKLAIEHQGGVLLRAGAGSGKTFVLVEHIVYLTKSWIAEYQNQKTESFEEFLRRKYSQVVMMTFTKKAAGEMSIRLTEMFAELSLVEGEEQVFWKMAYESLPVLMVTTIDGFCRKLITNGYFPHLSTEADIIFETERSDQVRDLLALWFEKRSSAVSSDILDIVIREKESLLSAFTSIFNDPGLRLAWKKYSLEETNPSKLGTLLTKSFELNDIQHALLAIGNLDLPVEKERSAFEKFVGEVQSSGLPVVDSVEKLLSYQKLFEGKRLMGESKADKKTLPSHINAHQGLKNLRDWCKTWSPVVQNYSLHYEGKILPWLKLCQELYSWVEERLDPNLGMTFGDIAYHVSLGLENKPDRERIQRDYRYFIVDEFQDTSALQFKIIQSLIGGDYRRLFCVGDAKQAIYGFRGGELSVFQDCGDLVPQVLSLANNYRSLPEVIRFNNSLFRTILPLGQEFEGIDPFSVEPEDQNLPGEVNYKEQGSIVMLKAVLERDLETEDKFRNEDMNRLEAYLVAEAVAQDRKNDPSEVCTILYSKLKPSHELIK
jgi:ATP-dependent exoDNAse (exonuclease V) beta subunit